MSRTLDTREQGLKIEQDPRLEEATQAAKGCFSHNGELSHKFQHELNGLKKTIANKERAEGMGINSYQDDLGRHTPIGQKPSHSIVLGNPASVNLDPEAISKLPSVRALKAELEKQGLTIEPRVVQVFETSIRGPREDIGAHRMALEVQRNGTAELRDPPQRPKAADPDTRETLKKLREQANAPKKSFIRKLLGK